MVGTSSTTTGSGGKGTSASSSSAGGSGGAGGGGPVVGYGDVFLDVDPSLTLLDGFFAKNAGGSGGGGGGGCNVQTFGACQVQDCSALGTGGAGGSAPTPAAGFLSVKSGSLTLSAKAAPDGSYDAQGPGAQPWSDAGGEDVVFHATGGVVPAFTLHFGSPGVVHVAEPAFPSDPTTAMTLSTSQDILVIWFGGAADATVEVDLDDNAGTGLVFGQCDVPANIGKVTIPSGALAWLKGKNASISVSAFTSGSVTVQGWQTTGTAFSSGIGAQGQSAENFNVDFQ